jgi:nickel transport protein
MIDTSDKEAPSPLQRNSPCRVDLQEIETIVERAVERKLTPIKAQLAGPAWGFRDIVAGIGYILGLMGLASYLHHRKTSQKHGIS